MKKKSLIDALRTTKKANAISTAAKNEGKSTRKSRGSRQANMARDMKM